MSGSSKVLHWIIFRIKFNEFRCALSPAGVDLTSLGKCFSLYLNITTVTATLLFAQLSLAQSNPSSAGDEYSNATPGATSAKELMAKDANNITCNKGLCTLFAVTVNKQDFAITSYVGNGMMGPQAGTGTSGVNNYYGSTTQQNPGTLGYGLQITWAKTRCTKSVAVDKSVYDSVTAYMTQLINTKPGENPTYPQFTPAEQTMILFYTTVMELTKGTTCT